MPVCKCNPKFVYVSQQAFDSHKCYKKPPPPTRTCWTPEKSVHGALLLLKRSTSDIFKSIIE